MKKTRFSELLTEEFSPPVTPNELIANDSNTLELLNSEEQKSNEERLLKPEAAFDGFSPALHPHASSKAPDEEDSFFETLLNNIKSVDGIDDSAQLAGMLLEGSASPIASTCVLALAIPFTLLGILGMKSEHEEAKRNLAQIISRQGEAKDNLQALYNFSQEQRRILQEKFQLDLPEGNSSLNFEESFLTGETGETMDKIAHKIGEYQSLRNKELIFALAAKYGWTGISGMVGMLGGVVPLAASSSLAIANEIHASLALQSAMSALNLASSSFFLVGQASMAVYGINAWRQGSRANKILEQIEKKFIQHAQGFIQKSTMQNVREIFAKQKNFIQKHSIDYGRLTTIGQALLISGTSFAMSGVGLAVSTPIFSFGAPLAFSGAVIRANYQEKERKFKGKNLNFTEDALVNFNPLHLFDKHLAKPLNKRHASILKELDLEFDSVTTKLANVKALSLLSHLINDRSYSFKTPEQKLAKLQDRLKANQSFLQGSGLEGSVIEKMQSFFVKNESKFKELLKLDKGQANLALRSLVPIFMRGKFELDASQADQTLDEEVLEKLGIPNLFTRRDVDHKFSLRTTLQKGKEALKSLRYQLADNIVRVTQTIEVCQTLNLNSTQEPPTSISAVNFKNVLEASISTYKSKTNPIGRSIGEDFRVVNGIYESGLKEIKNTMFDVIVLVTGSSIKVAKDGKESVMQLQDALDVIEKAKVCGGVSVQAANNDNVKFAQWEKDFSENLQTAYKKCGILSGRENSNVGMRSARISSKILQKLRDAIPETESVKKQLFEDAVFGVNYAQGRYERLQLQIAKNIEESNDNSKKPNQSSLVGNLQKIFSR